MRTLVSIAAALVLASVSMNAAASPISVNAIAETLEMQGYSVEPVQQNVISVSVGELSILIGVAGPDGDISYLTYLSGFSVNQVSHEFLSRFNRDIKFGRAYIDRDGDVTIQMDRNASGGISLKNIESDFDVFLSLVSKFLSDLESATQV
ncbi:MAG: YbjN domain-containing protein [Pseudomonadota bacterium]